MQLFAVINISLLTALERRCVSGATDCFCINLSGGLGLCARNDCDNTKQCRKQELSYPNSDDVIKCTIRGAKCNDAGFCEYDSDNLRAKCSGRVELGQPGGGLEFPDPGSNTCT